jgi:hypothetical protein
MKVPFKEKTYEKYLFAELARKTNQCFSPDPCDEAFLGFDDSFDLPLLLLFLMAPHVRERRRHRRSFGVLLSTLAHLPNKVKDNLPEFRLNLFLQYKRPEHMKRSDAAEWSHWGDRYYRYTIEPDQQAALELLDNHAMGRACVLYASAAFHRTGWCTRRSLRPFFRWPPRMGDPSNSRYC